VNQEKRLCVREKCGVATWCSKSNSDELGQPEHLFHSCLDEELLWIVAFTLSYFGFCFSEKEYLALFFISLLYFSALLFSSFRVSRIEEKIICSSVKE